MQGGGGASNGFTVFISALTSGNILLMLLAILLLLEGAALGFDIIFLILSKGNKLSPKETFASNRNFGITVVVVILVALLSAFVMCGFGASPAGGPGGPGGQPPQMNGQIQQQTK